MRKARKLNQSLVAEFQFVAANLIPGPRLSFPGLPFLTTDSFSRSFAFFAGKKKKRPPRRPQSKIQNLKSKMGLLLSFEERFQPSRSRRMPQLTQGLRFDLTDTLAGDGEMLPDFLKRML